MEVPHARSARRLRRHGPRRHDALQPRESSARRRGDETPRGAEQGAGESHPGDRGWTADDAQGSAEGEAEEGKGRTQKGEEGRAEEEQGCCRRGAGGAAAAAAHDGVEFDDSDDDDDDEESSSSDSSYDSDDPDGAKKKRAARRPQQLSEAAQRRRDEARAEKAAKERYIEERQEELRQDRAAQAKRRLDFLLKQSDIFSHFGNVKEDTTKLGMNKNQQQKVETEAKGDDGVVISHRDRRREGGMPASPRRPSWRRETSTRPPSLPPNPPRWDLAPCARISSRDSTG